MSLTDRQLIEEVARIDGWIQGNSMPPEWVSPTGHKFHYDYGNYSFFPKYLTSYDAILPVVQKQWDKLSNNQKVIFWRELKDNGFCWVTKTPREITIALVKAVRGEQ